MEAKKERQQEKARRMERQRKKTERKEVNELTSHDARKQGRKEARQTEGEGRGRNNIIKKAVNFQAGKEYKGRIRSG